MHDCDFEFSACHLSSFLAGNNRHVTALNGAIQETDLVSRIVVYFAKSFKTRGTCESEGCDVIEIVVGLIYLVSNPPMI